ncbi:hypothetical protein MTR67_050332 [Solanum verrucosum]|uniref:Uncharacterized protein n=1 Tax=Solanum verrucosum TaxID=315347 RepID=A0AAF0V281_SOLVR|nr:hypothetical protein MTR67_050332 [Solanum verrucosum]
MEKNSTKSPIVYLRGVGSENQAWYRIDIESLRLCSVIDTAKPKTECTKCYAMTIRPHPEPMKLSPFTHLENPSRDQIWMWEESWTIDGEDIYYIGNKIRQMIQTNSDLDNPPRRISRDLLKLNLKNPSSGWKIISSSSNFLLPGHFSRSSHFVALIGRKLYVLGWNYDRVNYPREFKEDDNYNEEREFEDDNNGENYWGEIFDLDLKKWEVIELDMKSSFGDHPIRFSYSVLEKEGEDSRIVLFPRHNKGRLMFYNVCTREFVIEDHPCLDLNGAAESHPKGLEDCEDIRYIQSEFDRKVELVVNDSTFYWFTDDLYLYGYDFVEKRWYQSKCLKTELWTIPQSRWWVNESYNWNGSFVHFTQLVDLGKGKFLLIFRRDGVEFALAIVDVVKERDSLNVSVESLHTLLVDDTCFFPIDVMVMK